MLLPGLRSSAGTCERSPCRSTLKPGEIRRFGFPDHPPGTEGMETSQLPPSSGQTRAPGSLGLHESTGQDPCTHHRAAWRSTAAPTRYAPHCCSCSLRAALLMGFVSRY